MLNIAIENPRIEEFVKTEFKGDTDAFVQNIYEFMRFYKIKRETLEAREQIARGEFLEEEEVFESILKKYEN